MKKKLHFLFSMVALMLVATFAKAQVTIDTDYTTKLDIASAAWKGSSGLCATQFAPAITTKDGRTAQLAEKYETTVATKGDLITQTVSGLPNGTYRVSIYANAFFTSGRGFNSEMEDGSDDVCYVFAGKDENRVQQFITARIATSTTENNLRTLENVKVTDGTLVVGLGKAKEGTNWHTVQVYEITATVDAAEALATAVAAANAVNEADVPASIYSELQTAVSENNKAYETAAEYEAAIKAINDAVAAAAPFATAKPKLDAMKALVDATNVYTADAYEEYYGQWAAKFDAGTLTNEEAQALQDPSVVTGWHASITVDNFLLSAWDTNPDFQNAPYYINTWSVEGESDGTNFKVPFFEYFVGDDASLGAKTLTATMEGLIPGQYYKATAWVRNQPKKDVAAADITGITLQVNDGTPVDVTEGEVKGGFNIGEFSAKGVVGEDGKLLIKFIVADESNSHWLSFKNVKFEATEPDYGITIDNEITNGSVKANIAEAEAGTKVVLTITPAEGYQLETLSVKAGEETIEVAEDNTFVMPAAAVTISATFAEIPATQYAITISDGIENGTVEASPAKAAAGETVTLTITPADGYELDELSVKAGEEDVEVAEGYTFLMPAAAVAISATFKEQIVEPEIPAVTATLVHTAGTGWGSNTGRNTVDGEAEYYNNEAAAAWSGAAFAEFSFELPKGATITKATLTWSATNGNNNGNRDNKIYYLNEGQTVDYEALTTSEPVLLYSDAKTYITNVPYIKGNPSAISDETDVTEAVKSLAAQKSIIFQWTGNGGGATLAGKASENAPKLVIEYIPGAPEIANASFEADGEKAASNGPLAITGWTETVDGSYNNSELRPANSASTTSMFGTSDPSDGEYSFFVRHGWNSNTTTITLTSDALGEIPAGDYTLSVDYKQHYAYDNTQNSNTKVSIALVNGETTLGSETSPAAAGVAGSGDATYFNDAEWSTLTAAFTLAEAIPAGAKVVITLDARGQKRSDFFLDNVQFVKIPGVELALLDLEKSLEAATDVKAKYVVGDDLFQYAASEIEPLTNAITTAQAAYNAAESKDAVNSAKETLDAFVATFAPAMNTPEAEKLYTFQLKLDGETPLYMNLTEEGITIAEKATPLSFVATENAGQFNLVSDGELYVGLAGGNAWTMSTAADKKAAWTFTALGNGEYNINNLVTPGRFVGTNAADKTAGTSCYADKQTSNGNVVWIIAEYVDPNDYTNMIVNADLKGEGGFDATGTKGIDGSGIVKASTQAEFDFKQTIANLPAGQYKLTAQAAYRYGGDEAAEAAAIAGGTETKLVQLYATVGEKTVAAPVQNRYDGASETDYANGEGSVVVNEKYVPNSSSAVKAWFAAGQYVNEVIFNITESGDVTIGINRTGTPESDYTVIGPWTLYRLGDAEVEPEVPSFAGIVEQTLTHPQLGEIGTTTSDQTVKIAEAGEGLVDITFSGFSIEAPPTTLEQFTISNVAAETAADGSITYAAGNFQIATKMGQIDVYYNGTLEGVQASAEATPLFKLVLTNGVIDEVYFGADQDAIDAYKASLQPAVYAIAIADEIEGGEVEADVEEAAEGAKVTLTITPDQDYKLGTVTVSYVEGEGEGAETKYVEVAEDYTFTMPAAPVTVSATFTYVEPLDPNLIEIAQSQSPQISDGATRATVVEGDGYTQYTTDGDVCVIVKMYDVDVTGCDYVVIKFAEPIPSGICAAFWAQGSLDNIELDAGITEYKYVFANDTKCAIQNGILPQITLLTLWNAQTVKISGIYKHLDEEGQVQINDIDAAKAKRNGKFYKKGQFVILNEGKAFSLNGIETE